jgi:DNA-binding NarL/FixJ family response regulator
LGLTERQNRLAHTGHLSCAIADRSATFAAGLSFVLQQQAGIDIVAEAYSEPTLYAAMDGRPIDVLVVGFEPLPSAISVARAMAPVPTLLLASSLGPSHVIDALRAGVLGLLSKDARPDLLREAVRLVASGRRAFPEGWELSVAEWVTNSGRLDRRYEIEPLTVREGDIVQLVVDGLSNKQIARALGISVQTVKNHAHNVMTKLNISSRTELVVWALDGRFSPGATAPKPSK